MVMPHSMKAIMEIMTSPTTRSNATPSVEQYRTNTSWGMWYFSLNNSIKAGVFTKRSNLPILSLRMREQRVKEVIRGDKGSLEKKTYIDYDANWSSYLSWIFGVFFVKIWWTVWWVRRVEVWVLWNYELWWKKKEMAFRSLYRRNWKWGGRYPAQILKKKFGPLD